MTSYTSADRKTSQQPNTLRERSEFQGMCSPIQRLRGYTRLYRSRRTCIAYSDPGLAGVGLVGAVLRQGSFIEKMVGMGWAVGGRLDTAECQAAFVRCIARYHGFLWLMSGQPGRLFVPTLVCHLFATQGSTYSDLAA